MQLTFIDLGLPSGTLWAAENAVMNGKTHFSYEEAVKTFGDMLPSADAWEELIDRCDGKWDKDHKGYVLTSPNGNTLFLPAEGWTYKNKGVEGVEGVGSQGFYWSSTPRDEHNARRVHFHKFSVYPHDNDNRHGCFSIRLCKTK